MVPMKLRNEDLIIPLVIVFILVAIAMSVLIYLAS